MSSDLNLILIWWVWYLIIGFSALPLTYKLFSRFFDFGYIFSKIIGTVILSYLTLVLGIFRLSQFSQTNLWIHLVIIFIFGVVIVGWKNFVNHLSKNFRKIFIYEIIFLVILISWSYVRGFAPDIEGLEKFMDWGFVNTILRSQYFPPVDMWFSGSPINYYYFGHFVVAVITKLSRLDSAVTYNLAIASTCALTFTTSLSLVSNLVHFISKNKLLIYITAILGATALTFGGNLHTVYKVGKNIINNEGRLIVTSETIKKATSAYWYPDATRFIGFDPDVKDKTIHEFPVYSFVVADLHGHMNDIPVVITIIAILAVNFLFSPIFLPFVLGFFLSVAYMTNAWDFAVYGILYSVISLIINWSKTSLFKAITSTFIGGILTILFWLIFSLPFSLNFKPMGEGLMLSDSHTPFYQLFVLYGGFWIIIIPFIIFILYLLKKHRQSVTLSDLFVVGLFITATLLIIIPEIGYIKDIYIYEHRRANTMFKLVYQAFIIYSLSMGYCLARLRKFVPYTLIFFTVFIAVMIYPYFAIKSFYGLKEYRGLYGMNFIKNLYPDNFRAIQWINENIVGQPNIVEAVGDSYTTFGQFSIATGLPTIQGWIVHEWLWRGSYDYPSARQEEVRLIYESENLDEIRQILQKYNIKYIIFGPKEAEKYQNIDGSRFEQLGARRVFYSGDTTIFAL